MDEKNVDVNKDVAPEAIQGETQTAKPVSNLIKFGIPMLIIILIVGAVFGKSLLKPKDPSTLLALAYANSYDKKEIDASLDMNMDINIQSDDPQDAEISEMLKHVNISGDVKANFTSEENFALSESLVYNYDDIELLALTLFLDKDKLAIHVPTFLEKWVVADYDKAVDLAATYSGMDLNFSIKDYYKLFTTKDIENIDVISADYGTFIMEKIKDKLVLGEDTTITTKGDQAKDYTCTAIDLTLTMEEYYSMYFELLEKAIADTRFESIIKSKIDMAIEISRDNGVLDLLGITEEAITALNENFSEAYAEGIKAINDEMNLESMMAQVKEMGMSDSNFKFTFYIDKDNNIRGLKEDLVIAMPNPDMEDKMISMKINMNMVYNSYENVVVTSPNLDTAYDITVDPETTAMTIMFEVQSKLATYLQERPQLQELMDSLQ